MFACPYCGLQADRDANPRKSQWSCRRCHASSITFSFLRNLAGTKYGRTLEAEAESKPRDGKPCPHCPKKMARAKSPRGGTHVELDVCNDCGLVWFDPGEVISALERLGKNPDVPSRRAVGDLDTLEVSVEARYPDEILPILLGLPEIENQPEVGNDVYGSLALGAGILFLSVRGILNPKWLASVALIPSAGLRPSTWLSSIFVHFSWFHLLNSLAFFVMFGPAVETRIGSQRYVIAFVLGGLVGNLAASVLSLPNDVWVGAGGAVSTVLVLYARLFPKAHISFFELQSNIYSIFAWRYRFPAELLVVAFFFTSILAHTSFATQIAGALVGIFFPLPRGTSRIKADVAPRRRKR